MAIGALHSNAKYFSLVNDIVIAFRRMIKDAPTIDAVEVVRCKDCIHAEKMKPRLAGKVVVFCYLHKRERFVLADGYCESGERKEE